MLETAFIEAVRRIYEKDSRYHPDSYVFIRESLDFTSQRLEKPREGPGHHVTGAELAEGIREYEIREFGPMAMRVLNSWGISKTRDFGEIVFNLVESGMLGKTAEDSIDDFNDRYDFVQAFSEPLLPSVSESGQAGRFRSKYHGGHGGVRKKRG